MHTTTVLTIELPPELSYRLRQALRERPEETLRDVALEALEEWLDRNGLPAAPEVEAHGFTPEG